MSERFQDTSRKTFVTITLNRASLGEASHVFAMVDSIPDFPNHIAYVPQKDITINQQLVGKEISAKLKVKIVEENQDGFVVETEDSGNQVRWKINREGKIIPAKLKPIFNI